MPKTPAEPQSVNEDGSPILPPPSTGAQAPTVVDGTVSVVPSDATANPSAQPDNALGDAQADTAETIAAPGPADATAAIDSAALGVDPTDDDPDAAPQFVGVCSNPECQVAEVQLWKPVDEAPIMCQCGQMLEAPKDDTQPE